MAGQMVAALQQQATLVFEHLTAWEKAVSVEFGGRLDFPLGPTEFAGLVAPFLRAHRPDRSALALAATGFEELAAEAALAPPAESEGAAMGTVTVGAAAAWTQSLCVGDRPWLEEARTGGGTASGGGDRVTAVAEADDALQRLDSAVRQLQVTGGEPEPSVFEAVENALRAANRKVMAVRIEVDHVADRRELEAKLYRSKVVGSAALPQLFTSLKAQLADLRTTFEAAKAKWGVHLGRQDPSRVFVSQRLPAVTQWAGGSWLSGVRSLDCAGLGEAMPHSASMLVRSLAAKMIQTAEAVAARDAALDRPTCPGLLALPRLSNHPRDRNPGKAALGPLSAAIDTQMWELHELRKEIQQLPSSGWSARKEIEAAVGGLIGGLEADVRARSIEWAAADARAVAAHMHAVASRRSHTVDQRLEAIGLQPGMSWIQLADHLHTTADQEFLRARSCDATSLRTPAIAAALDRQALLDRAEELYDRHVAAGRAAPTRVSSPPPPTPIDTQGTPSGPKTTAELWALIAQLDQQIDQASVERAAAAAAVQKLTGSGPPAGTQVLRDSSGGSSARAPSSGELGLEQLGSGNTVSSPRQCRPHGSGNTVFASELSPRSQMPFAPLVAPILPILPKLKPGLANAELAGELRPVTTGHAEHLGLGADNSGGSSGGVNGADGADDGDDRSSVHRDENGVLQAAAEGAAEGAEDGTEDSAAAGQQGSTEGNTPADAGVFKSIEVIDCVEVTAAAAAHLAKKEIYKPAIEGRTVDDIGPLPPGWKCRETHDGRWCYYNREVGKTSWSRPEPLLEPLSTVEEGPAADEGEDLRSGDRLNELPDASTPVSVVGGAGHSDLTAAVAGSGGAGQWRSPWAAYGEDTSSGQSSPELSTPDELL